MVGRRLGVGFGKQGRGAQAEVVSSEKSERVVISHLSYYAVKQLLFILVSVNNFKIVLYPCDLAHLCITI